MTEGERRVNGAFTAFISCLSGLLDIQEIILASVHGFQSLSIKRVVKLYGLKTRGTLFSQCNEKRALFNFKFSFCLFNHRSTASVQCLFRFCSISHYN